jgi:hypothetical protein
MDLTLSVLLNPPVISILVILDMDFSLKVAVALMQQFLFHFARVGNLEDLVKAEKDAHRPKSILVQVSSLCLTEVKTIF